MIYTDISFKLNNPHILKFVLLLIVILNLTGNTVNLLAQNKKISIHSENNQVIDATNEPATQYLNGDVKVYHGGAFMYCDNAVLKGADLRMYFNVVLLQNDTIKIFADSLHYNGDSLVAYLYGDIILENGPDKKLYTSYLRYDVKNKIAYYTQNAKLVDKTATLISRRGRYVLNEKTAYFYEKVKVTADDFTMISDSLAYQTVTQEMKFLAPVRITRDTSNIYSEKGWFDLDDKKGDFIGNAQYLAGKTQAKADTITYDGIADHIILKSSSKRSEYISEKDTAYAQTIFYNKKEETFNLHDNAHYKGGKNEVKGNNIFYNKVQEKFKVTGRSIVSDPPMLIEADTLDYDKNIKFGKADGHVIWKDTSAKTSIIADHVIYNGVSNNMLAVNDTLRPMFTTEISGDTLFLRADTLKSFRQFKERIIYPDKNASRLAAKANSRAKKAEINFSDPTIKTEIIQTDTTAITTDSIITDTIYTGIIDTLDYFVAYNKVRLFKSDMQAVADSLVFAKSDSVFTMYKYPIVWSDSTQVSGDTIDLFLKDKKLDKMKVKSQANILNSPDLLFFNQIQGRIIESFFEQGKIKRIDVNGNARMVYYLFDEKDKSYSGVNTTEASTMTFHLKQGKVSDIYNYLEPKSIVYPMKSTNHDQIKIKGFKWVPELRPVSRDDL